MRKTEHRNVVIARWFFALVLLCCQSCKMNSWSEKGFYFDDLDRYFHPDEQISVWIYLDFHGEDPDRGIRTDRLYPMDSEIIKRLGLDKPSHTVLFSATPQKWPFYHLMAVKHKRENWELETYSKIVSKDGVYYQRDFSWNGMIVRHLFIPYAKKTGLSLVYYNTRDAHQECPFCELDHLLSINLKSVPFPSKESFRAWQVWDCPDDQQVSYRLPSDLIEPTGHRRMFLRIYERFEDRKLLSYFRIVDRSEKNTVSVHLCPGEYEAEFRSAEGELLSSWSFEPSD